MEQRIRWVVWNQETARYVRKPPERKYVLVMMWPTKDGYPCGVAMGYRRTHAGVKSESYWVIPGLAVSDVIAWCDCLPEGMDHINFEKLGEKVIKELLTNNPTE